MTRPGRTPWHEREWVQVLAVFVVAVVLVAMVTAGSGALAPPLP